MGSDWKYWLVMVFMSAAGIASGLIAPGAVLVVFSVAGLILVVFSYQAYDAGRSEDRNPVWLTVIAGAIFFLAFMWLTAWLA